jgi:polyisoprenoid-binding protein YceI
MVMKLQTVGVLLVLFSLATVGCGSADNAGDPVALTDDTSPAIHSPIAQDVPIAVDVASSSEPAVAETLQPEPSASHLPGPQTDEGVVPAGNFSGLPSPPALAADGLTPVRVASGSVALSPESAQVNFVGQHTNVPEPDPMARRGGFGAFSGQIQIDPETKLPSSIQIEIDATTLWTDAGGRLTNHLKSADFLNVNEFSKITFQSTSVTPLADAPGKATVKGNLTLHGVTKEVSFPVTAGLSESGATLTSEFEIQRTDFGMNQVLNVAIATVDINVVVGKKTEAR